MSEPVVNPVPHHLAIVMDGNGRWASKRFLPRIAGHRQGLESLKRCVRACVQRGIRVLTVFAFSTENWRRPEDEVSGLMDLFLQAVSREVAQLQAQGVRLHFVGAKEGLSPKVMQGMQTAQAQTAHNERLIINVCFNYGGRWDIVQAAAQLAASGQAVTQEALSAKLCLAHVPDPDLIIRTGGEQRVSNFLLWQGAYAEYYFSDALWPDFDEAELDRAIASFASRERRFGLTSGQVQQEAKPALSV